MFVFAAVVEALFGSWRELHTQPQCVRKGDFFNPLNKTISEAISQLTWLKRGDWCVVYSHAYRIVNGIGDCWGGGNLKIFNKASSLFMLAFFQNFPL
jgi:hypothetical protein